MPTNTRASDASLDRLQHLEEQLTLLVSQQEEMQRENTQLRERVATFTTLPPTVDQESSEYPQDPLPIQHGYQREQSSAPTALTTGTIGKPSEPKVASPEHFTGQRNKLKTFLTQVTMVITLQPSRFTTETSKVFYTGSYLRDTALLWFQPYVTANPQPAFMSNFNLFQQELQAIFGDPDEIGTAERQLYALQQRGSVTSYLTEFQRLTSIIKWNDEAKSAQFYRGLKDIIKDELARSGKPRDLKELQEAAIRIDTRLFERQVEKGTRTHLYANNPIGYQQRFQPRTSYTSTQTRTIINKPPESLNAITANPKNLTKRGKLNPAEYQRRKDNNLCLYCGDKGHQVLKCPIAPPAKPRTQLQAVTTAPVKKLSSNQGKE